MTKVVVLYSGGRQWGGIETYLANLFRLYDREAVELVLASLGDWELTRAVADESSAAEVKVLSGSRVRPQTVLDLKRLLGAEKADLLVSQGTVANAYARAAGALARVPNLTVVHSDTRLDYPRALIRWTYEFIDRLLRFATKRYVTVSRHLARQLIASGVRPERVRTIYNGVDAVGRPSGDARGGATGGTTPGGATTGGVTGGTTPCGATTGSATTGATTTGASRAAADAARQDGLALATVGRLHPVKNFDGLIEAMRLLPEQVTLTIWGEGPQREQLETLVQSLGLAERVRLPGESKDMQEALTGADVYVQPSKSEGCSFAVAEAMLHGKPVVVTPRGGLPEQVEHRVTGLVATDCDPEAIAAVLRELVDDPALAARLGETGRKSATQMFSMQKWLTETTAAFTEAAKAARAAAAKPGHK